SRRRTRWGSPSSGRRARRGAAGGNRRTRLGNARSRSGSAVHRCGVRPADRRSVPASGSWSCLGLLGWLLGLDDGAARLGDQRAALVAELGDDDTEAHAAAALARLLVVLDDLRLAGKHLPSPGEGAVEHVLLLAVQDAPQVEAELGDAGLA